MTKQEVKLTTLEERQRKRHKTDHWSIEVHRQLDEFFRRERLKRTKPHE